MALSNDLREVLARRRQPRSIKVVLERVSEGAIGADEPDRIPVTVGDPDNDIDSDANIDPDDVATFTPLPPMPCSWWIRMTLDPSDTLVTAEDAGLCLALVRARLNATVGRQASQDAVPALIEAGQGGDSGNSDWGDGGPDKALEYNVSLPTTIGSLHERIESLASGAWQTFVELWQSACDIPAPQKDRPLGRRFRPGAAPIDDSAAVAPAATPCLEVLRRPPDNGYQLDEGLSAAILKAPPKVQAMLLHSPTPPMWQYQESEGEKAERLALEDIGGWVGF
jgi:hypothetical protein